MLRYFRGKLAVPVAGWFFLLAVAAAQAEPVKITFLHTNDVYEIAPKKGKGGLAELMTLLKAERAAAEHSITTFGGDLISPSILSGLLEGAQMIELMNALGVDVAVPGNHEFDFGPEVARQRIAEAKFPWLGSNVIGADGKPAVGMAGVHTTTVGSYRIGFFGLLSPETDTLSSPGPSIRFEPVVEAAKQAVKQLQDAGADVIVALTHLDLADDREIVRSVKGIHLVLGGHDHDPITFYERGVLIQKAGYDAHYLAAVDLLVDRVERRGKTVIEALPAWRMVSTRGVTPDPEIKKIVDGYNTRLDQELGQSVGTTTVMLDSQRGSVRTGESGFANLIADAMREAVGADVAITNGGGIRGDRTYDPGTVLTRKDILTELPFGNVVVLVELSGGDLLQALENGVSRIEDVAGRFPHLSGMTLTYDPKAPKGKRVVSAQIGGKDVDPGNTYTVATNDYMAGGGDGYAALTRGTALIDASAGKLMATTVMDYIAAKASIAPKLEGRTKAVAAN
jgi:2',3'-cyclic-nucleotide 2'-phosphodiesterase (5'-nucleotidase family)